MAVGWAGQQIFGPFAVQMPPANFKACSRYQNTSGVDLTMTTVYGIWLAAGAFAPGLHVKAIVYSDVGTLPSALLAVSAEVTAVPAGPVAFAFATPWVWPAGAWRWVGMIADTMLDTQLGIVPALVGGIKYNANTYGSGPTDPFGAALTADFEYILWAEGYDGAQRLGRISIGGAGGQYYALDAHYEKFTLGGPSAPVTGSSVNVSSLAVYATSAVTVQAHGAIYHDDGAAFTPAGATLVAVTNEVSAFAANAWTTLTFPGAVTLTPGNYWLAIICQTIGPTTDVTQYSGRLSSAGGVQTNPAFYTWADPVSGLTPPLSDQHPKGISIYANYAESAVPETPPVIPRVSCAPQTRVSSPAKSAGCNSGGVGFTNEYLGASGVVAIGADPPAGETLTGKRAIHVWGEITHVND